MFAPSRAHQHVASHGPLSAEAINDNNWASSFPYARRYGASPSAHRRSDARPMHPSIMAYMPIIACIFVHAPLQSDAAGVELLRLVAQRLHAFMRGCAGSRRKAHYFWLLFVLDSGHLLAAAALQTAPRIDGAAR